MTAVVSPNPVKTSAKVIFTNPNHEPFRLEVYDIIGNRLQTAYNEDKDYFDIDALDLSDGMYFYFIFKADHKILTGRLIVKH